MLLSELRPEQRTRPVMSAETLVLDVGHPEARGREALDAFRTARDTQEARLLYINHKEGGIEMRTLVLVCVILSVPVLCEDLEQVYFIGSVSWDGQGVDYAVLTLRDLWGDLVDSLHLSEPGDYEFGYYTDSWAEQYDPFRLDCWLVDGETISLPLWDGPIWFPEDFEWHQSHYHIHDFEW